MTATANKQKGSQWERDILFYLRNEGYDAERLHLAGKDDEGDIILKLGGLPYIIEAKNEKRIDLAGYVTEAAREAANYGSKRGLGLPGVNYIALVKRRQAGTGEAYAVTPLHEWLRHVEQASPPF